MAGISHLVVLFNVLIVKMLDISGGSEVVF
jgi:hypothetical protein